MSATAFKADMEDIRFVLLDQLDIDATLRGMTKYAEFDQPTYEAMIEEARRVAEEVLAPINRAADRAGIRFDGKGNVTTPPGFKEAWQALAAGGWLGVTNE